MLQTIIFYGSDPNPQLACNTAASRANAALKALEVDKDDLLSSTTNYVSSHSEIYGTCICECVITLVVETLYDLSSLLQTAQQEEENSKQRTEDYTAFLVATGNLVNATQNE